MTNNRHLHFISGVWKEKVEYQGGGPVCPFCNRTELAEILDEDGPIILVKNKFATVANAFQTVLIETDDCQASIQTYDPTHMRRIITFGIDRWLSMEQSGNYTSVLFYKNHGPLSGGSIKHAHMQIVGISDIDYRQNLSDKMFEGIEIHRADGGLLNLSTKPNACSTEFNIITTPRADGFMAETIQRIVKYILDRLSCGSYNLFFYQWRGSIICKVVPRYVTSPFLVGFSIPQTSDRLIAIAEELRLAYGNDGRSSPSWDAARA